MGLSDWPGGADPQTAVVLTYAAAFVAGISAGAGAMVGLPMGLAVGLLSAVSLGWGLLVGRVARAL